MQLPVMPPLKPMLARSVPEVPDGHLDEPKWDGFRRRWKVKSTGVYVARAVRAFRNRARASWLDEHGQSLDRCPLQHPPAVLWFPECAYAVCLRCDWLGLNVWTRRGRRAGPPARSGAATR